MAKTASKMHHAARVAVGVRRAYRGVPSPPSAAPPQRANRKWGGPVHVMGPMGAHTTRPTRVRGGDKVSGAARACEQRARMHAAGKTEVRA